MGCFRRMSCSVEKMQFSLILRSCLCNFNFDLDPKRSERVRIN